MSLELQIRVDYLYPPGLYCQIMEVHIHLIIKAWCIMRGVIVLVRS